VKKFKAQLNYLFQIQKQEKKSVSNPKAMKIAKLDILNRKNSNKS